MREFEERLEKSRVLIERGIARYIPKNEVPNLHDAIQYAMASRGKRLRPFLCIETCRLLGGNVEKSLPYAVACELMHNWTLIHDDIEDGDEIRRGQPTVWKKFGVAHAINAGDLMAHEVFGIILDSDISREKILKLIALTLKAAIETGEGQALEFNFKDSESIDEQEYITIAMKKTSYIIACPLIGGSIIADGDNTQDLLLEYSKNLGVAFQIADDIIDLTPGKGRGEIGCDIKEGKKTLMVLHALRQCTFEEKQKILKILKKARHETTSENILYVKKIFEKYDSINYAGKRSAVFIEKARNSIKEMPQNLKNFLEECSDFVVQRQL